MSWHQNEVRKRVNVTCTKFGYRIYVVKIDRGAVIGRGNSPWSAYVRAYELLASEDKETQK